MTSDDVVFGGVPRVFDIGVILIYIQPDRIDCIYNSTVRRAAVIRPFKPIKYRPTYCFDGELAIASHYCTSDFRSK